MRENQPIGCRVTLRRDVMYEFFDRLVAAALPRIRDFRGISTRSFDGRGNFSLASPTRQSFLKSNWTKSNDRRMDITIVTSAPTDAEALDLLKMMACPLPKRNKFLWPNNPGLNETKRKRRR